MKQIIGILLLLLVAVAMFYGFYTITDLETMIMALWISLILIAIFWAGVYLVTR